MKTVKSICVFCGSRNGSDPAHLQMAETLGTMLAEKSIRLIYGGGGIGLMRAVAQATIASGGKVTGIIPRFLIEYEVGDVKGVDTVVVGSMHERKNKMFELADAFVILPGGIGTLDETIEILTWKQLQIHNKPVILLNQDGFWDPLLALIERVIDGGFAHPKVADLYAIARSPEHVFDAIASAPEPDRVVLTSHL